MWETLLEMFTVYMSVPEYVIKYRKKNQKKKKNIYWETVGIKPHLDDC